MATKTTIAKQYKQFDKIGQYEFRSYFDQFSMGEIQAAGYLQLIPLIAPNDLDDLAHTSDLYVAAAEMGVIKLENESSQWALVPAHTTFIVGSAMQDQAMTSCGIIPPKQSKVYINAACVQAYQTGLIARQKYQPNFLPFEVRECAYSTRHVIDYTKLYDRLTWMNYRNRLGKVGRLRYYFRHFEHELNRFVAEFEPVPGQVGALVLIDKYLVGVEVVPSRAFWLKHWHTLIRESYGALALEYQNYMGNRPSAPSHKMPFGMNGLQTIEDIEKELRVVHNLEQSFANIELSKFFGQQFQVVEDEKEGDYSVQTLFNKHFIGQVLFKQHQPVFLSICKRYSTAYDELLSATKQEEDNICLVCGYDKLNMPPHRNGAPSYERCKCCGNRAGIEDFLASFEVLRTNWLKQGALWFSPAHQPKAWGEKDIIRQLSHISQTDVPFEVTLRRLNKMAKSSSIAGRYGTMAFWTRLVNQNLRTGK